MDRSEVLPVLLGALVAGFGTAAFSVVGPSGGYAVVVGLALAVPVLRAETFGGFGSGRDHRPAAAFAASLGGLAVGTAAVALVGALAPGVGSPILIGVGGGGAFAGSYAGDLLLQFR